MKHKLYDALNELSNGIDGLLDCLVAEPSLVINYQALQLREATQKLRRTMDDLKAEEATQ